MSVEPINLAKPLLHELLLHLRRVSLLEEFAFLAELGANFECRDAFPPELLGSELAS